MNVLIKRYLKAILYIFEHQRRLQVSIIVILTLALLAWVAHLPFNEIAICGVHLSSESCATVKLPERTRATVSPNKRRLFVRLPGLSARLGNRIFAHAAVSYTHLTLPTIYSV